MLSMIAAASPTSTGCSSAVSRASARLGRAAAFLAALVLAAPGIARAETGAPLPQGYTSDIPSGQAAAPSLKMKQVSDTDDESDEYADNDPSALTDFQEPLAPYGVWIDDGTYGTVWVPDVTVVGGDFAPYQSGGHWVLDDNSDWMWASDYDWGYIPFHYGRWVWIGGRGWAWIPGRTYAPAWVTWRVGEEGYIGWAPLPPTWYWSGGMAVGLWTTPYAAYCFCPTTYIFSERVYTHVVREQAVVRSAAAGTRPYKGAKPTVNGPHGTQPDAAHANHGFRPAGPTLVEAGVPASAAPKARVAPDTRARGFATRSATATTRRGVGAGRTLPSTVFPSHRAGGENPWIGGPAPVQRGAMPRGDLSSRGAPVYNNDPRVGSPPMPTQGSPRFSPPAGGAQFAPPAAPRFAPPPSSTPHFAPPPASTPRFSPPPSSSPRFSPPASSPRPSFSPPASRPSFSPPASRPSAPTFRPSAPSRPSSPSFGGGRSGGHRR